MGADTSGHDWWHVHRVLKLSQYIAAHEKDANMEVVELAALLHDIADWKFNDGDLEAGPQAVRDWLGAHGAAEELIEKVVYIVEHISFRGGTNTHEMQTLEGKIVQDADRLDALGAVGIARTFAFGGSAGRAMYDPDNAPAQQYSSFEEYRNSLHDSTTVNHFYEKLLLLKDRMHTATARKLAEHRHKVMEEFLAEFYQEWDGKR